MADYSIIEFGVYAFFAYSSMLMLIISTIKEVPMTKALSIARAIYLFPGILSAAILAFSGRDLLLQTEIITNVIKDLNTTETWTESITTVSEIELQNEVWITFHFFLFVVMSVYVITQMLILLTKAGKEKSVE